MTTDPVADMLTRIRNAVTLRRNEVNIPLSQLKVGIAKVLRREGYIKDFTVIQDERHGILRVYLKYAVTGSPVIRHIERVSKPGRRLYRGMDHLPPVMSGMGISILTTSKGILSDRECRKQRVGGEVVAKVS